MSNFKIIGHRGWGPTHNKDLNAPYPENTYIAFNHALKSGADGIELDVLLCKDNVPIVIHDRHLKNHVAQKHIAEIGDRFVHDFTFEELQKFDLGHEQRIPSLKGLLEFMYHAYPMALINLDVKNEKLVDPILNEIKKFQGTSLPDNVIISSYNWDLLKNFRSKDKFIHLVPAIKSALLFGKENIRPTDYLPLTDQYQALAREEVFRIHRELNCIAFDCSVTDLKDPLIKWAHECNVGLQISTSNDRVDAQSTNYNLLLKLKHAAQNGLPFVICKVDEPGPIKDRLAKFERQSNSNYRHPNIF